VGAFLGMLLVGVLLEACFAHTAVHYYHTWLDCPARSRTQRGQY